MGICRNASLSVLTSPGLPARSVSNRIDSIDGASFGSLKLWLKWERCGTPCVPGRGLEDLRPVARTHAGEFHAVLRVRGSVTIGFSAVMKIRDVNPFILVSASRAECP